MTKNEILGMLKLSMVSMVIDRLHMKKYGGLFREIELINKTQIRVDFLDKNCKILEEGEFSIYFNFESFEKMIYELELYTGKKVDKWKRYFVDPLIFYDESPEWNEDVNWDLFTSDFNNGLILLPNGFLDMNMCL